MEYNDITKSVVASSTVRANASNKFSARCFILMPKFTVHARGIPQHGTQVRSIPTSLILGAEPGMSLS